jgi:hypothetical protein
VLDAHQCNVCIAVALSRQRAQARDGSIGFAARQLIDDFIADGEATKAAKRGDPLQGLLELCFIRRCDGGRRRFRRGFGRRRLFRCFDGVRRALE